MNPEEAKKNTTASVAPAQAVDPSAAQASTAPSATAPKAGAFHGGDRDNRDRRGGPGGPGASRRGGPRKGDSRPPRAKPEYDSKMLNIRRVARVATGGRRFSFSVAIVVGDKKVRRLMYVLYAKAYGLM